MEKKFKGGKIRRRERRENIWGGRSREDGKGNCGEYRNGAKRS